MNIHYQGKKEYKKHLEKQLMGELLSSSQGTLPKEKRKSILAKFWRLFRWAEESLFLYQNQNPFSKTFQDRRRRKKMPKSDLVR